MMFVAMSNRTRSRDGLSGTSTYSDWLTSLSASSPKRRPRPNRVVALRCEGTPRLKRIDANSWRLKMSATIAHRNVRIDDVDIFYREAGPQDGPVLLLLHGFPSSSHMFRNLIPVLADKYHVVLPALPGYGESSAPRIDKFRYTFDNLTDVIERFTDRLGLSSYAMYLSDIGSSVGFRPPGKNPSPVTPSRVQNREA